MSPAAISSPTMEALLAENFAPSEEAVSPERLAYRKIAALLSSFYPPRLRPATASEEIAADWTVILPDCDPLDAAPGRWRLKDGVRRRTLQQMSNPAEMQKLLDALPTKPDDPVQRAIDAIVKSETLDFGSLPREDLAGLALASEWFRDILPTPDPFQIRNALPLSDVLSPMRKLDGAHFVGRSAELTRNH